MPDPTPLRTAEFDPKLKSYWMLSTIIVCIVTVIGIPLLIIVVPLCILFMGRYLDAMSCTLTDRTLEIKKGLVNKTESTIPLEKITDLQMYQGPIMRAMGLQGFRVETAGQSSTPGGSLVNMLGIVDTRGFREAVLAQRDARENRSNATHEASSAPVSGQIGTGDDSTALLRDIRDTLTRIENRLPSD